MEVASVEFLDQNKTKHSVALECVLALLLKAYSAFLEQFLANSPPPPKDLLLDLDIIHLNPPYSAL